MSAMTTNQFRFTTNATPALAIRRLTVSDLVIEEFDQWSNPARSVSSPTTMCWCRDDVTVDLTH